MQRDVLTNKMFGDANSNWVLCLKVPIRSSLLWKNLLFTRILPSSLSFFTMRKLVVMPANIDRD